MPAVTSAEAPVAVTGASGYVGAAIVLELVDAGYSVRCCVRDAANPLKPAHLLAMNAHGAPGQLTLHTADLLTPGDYDEVFAGCSAVFHVAAVLERDHAGGGQGSGDVTKREVYDGGFVATQNVLNSVKKSGTVKRIVYTSSVAGVVGGRPVDHVYTEADWADHGDLSGPKNELPFDYGRSKADTERMLYADAAADGSFDVISHNPWHVLGCVPGALGQRASQPERASARKAGRQAGGSLRELPKLFVSIIAQRLLIQSRMGCGCAFACVSGRSCASHTLRSGSTVSLGSCRATRSSRTCTPSSTRATSPPALASARRAPPSRTAPAS